MKTGIGLISPSDASKPMIVGEIGASSTEKMIANSRVKEKIKKQFNVGDMVRIIVRKEKFNRVDEPTCSESVYSIQSMEGNVAKLHMFKYKVPLKWLLKVSQNTETTIVRSEKDELTEQAKQRRDLIRGGLDME